MKVIYGIGRLKINRPSCVGVGVFDGLHLGHQYIIKKVVSVAKQKGLSSVILTFFPHPDSIIKSPKESPLLISLKHRLNLISSLGVDVCVVVRFNKSFMDIEAEDFILRVLVKRCHMKELVINRNFIFGREKKGNFILIKDLAKKLNFNVHFQNNIKTEGDVIISSTLIRSLIRKGDLDEAEKLLGRKVEVIGTVVGGDSRGRRLGFPTANIDPHHEVIPPTGVYLIQAWLENKRLFGLANIGFRPTFTPHLVKSYSLERGAGFKKNRKQEREIIEIHLLNFKENIYGRDLRVVFLKKLRIEKKFIHKEHLISQIKQDIEQAKIQFSL